MRTFGWLLAVVLVSVGLVAVPPTQSTPAAAAAAARPNVVVVMMDDMRWDELRYAPNAQRHITTRGIRFTNAYSPLPLCCPARASFLLGNYPHNHKVLTVSPPYGFGALNDRRTVATSMRAAGYNTGFVGKYLNGYGHQRSRVTGGASDRYKPAGWVDWMAGIEGRHPGGTYNYMSFTQSINRRVVYNRGKYSSDVIAGQATRLVSKYHRSTRPFFLWVNPVAPHFGGPGEKRDPRSYRKANGFVQQFKTPYSPAWVRGRFNRTITHAPGVPLRRAAEPDISDKPGYFRRYLENTRTEKARLLALQRQRAEAIYAWDRQFQRMIQALRSTGEYANTILVFTSDNGYFMGEHRRPPGKVVHYGESSRIPLVVAGPGIRRGVRHTPVTLPDLTATLLDLARAPRLSGMDGVSVRPALTGSDTPWTRPVLLEARGGTPWRSAGQPVGLSQFGVHTGRYKYVRYVGGFEELYDLATDPLELTGRQRDPAYAQVKAQLVDLWWRYAGCRGTSECAAPLPVELQLQPAELAAQEANHVRQRRTYYN